MTQRTINLYDGLEALYYFDSDYYDGTTGEIKDKSGHGRHATANGGPTVGVNGPNDFEAASFSGGNSGDYFDVDEATQGEFTELTLWALIKVNDETNVKSIQSYGPFSHSLRIFQNAITFRIFDKSGNKYIVAKNVQKNKWLSVFGVFDGTKSSIYINNEIGQKQKADITIRDNGLEGSIGASADGTGIYFDGDIAATGKWSRALLKSERDKLDDLTAPRRAML